MPLLQEHETLTIIVDRSAAASLLMRQGLSCLAQPYDPL